MKNHRFLNLEQAAPWSPDHPRRVWSDFTLAATTAPPLAMGASNLLFTNSPHPVRDTLMFAGASFLTSVWMRSVNRMESRFYQEKPHTMVIDTAPPQWLRNTRRVKEEAKWMYNLSRMGAGTLSFGISATSPIWGNLLLNQKSAEIDTVLNIAATFGASGLIYNFGRAKLFNNLMKDKWVLRSVDRATEEYASSSSDLPPANMTYK